MTQIILDALNLLVQYFLVFGCTHGLEQLRMNQIQQQVNFFFYLQTSSSKPDPAAEKVSGEVA